jgi:hypothetical protein
MDETERDELAVQCVEQIKLIANKLCCQTTKATIAVAIEFAMRLDGGKPGDACLELASAIALGTIQDTAITNLKRALRQNDSLN